MPPFSMMVRRPEPGSLAVARRIRDGALAYITPATEIAAQQEQGRRRVEEFRKEVERIRRSQNTSGQKQQPAPRNLGRDGQRSKHFQPPTGAPQGKAEEEQSGEDGEAQGEELSSYRQLPIERQEEKGRADAE